MMRSKKIRLVPFLKLQAVIWGLLGLLVGIFYSFGGLFIDSLVSLGWISTNETPGLSYGTVLAFGALIGMPVIFIVFGLVTSLIGGLLFNVLSKWLGWVSTNFE